MSAYELLIEKTEDGFRAIVFERYTEEVINAIFEDSEIHDDMKSVVDILDVQMPWIWAQGKDGFVTNQGLLEGVVLDKTHQNVNFGRAKNLGSLVKKVCETL